MQFVCNAIEIDANRGVLSRKLAKYSVGKKTPGGDKPALVKTGERSALSYEGMPFVTKLIESEEDGVQQCQAYVALIRSDGTIKEGENEEESEDEV